LRTRRHRNPEQGSSTVKAIVVFAILGFMAFAAYQIVPTLMAKFQLQDAVTTESRFAVAQRKSEEDIRADIMKKITELDIPATDKDLTVVTSPTTVAITVHYVVPVDLKVYKFDLDCNVTADSHAL
jgi:hypothetical protein